MSNNIKLYDNVSLYATPESENHLVTKGYADLNLGAYKTVSVITNPAISFTKTGQIFYLSLTSNATITLNSSSYTFGVNEIAEFTLVIFIASGVTVTFPEWMWHNNTQPTINNSGWYVIRCVTYDSGDTWLAKYEGSYTSPTTYKWVTTLSDATNHTGTSLRDAVSAASSGDTVLFAPGLEGTIILEQDEIAITQNTLTIDGKNKIIVSGNNTSRIFTCTTGTTNTSRYISNLTFINGLGGGNGGGAVYTTRPIMFDNCTFSGNTLSSNSASGGGACSIQGGVCIFNNCTFTNNSTQVYYGGAIYNTGDTLTLNNCTFNGNTNITSGNGYGGAIYSTKNIIATDCVFTNNQATVGTNGKGGVICSVSQTPNVSFTRCTFSGNSAKARGGAFNLECGGSLTLIDCTLIENTVTGGNGGAINIGSDSGHPDVVISGCTFDGNACNYASGNTGAANFYKCASVDIHDCIFKNNTSVNLAPVLRVTGYSGHGTHIITRCLFTGNIGNKGNDGLIFLNGGITAMTISDCVWTRNSYTSNATGTYLSCIRLANQNTITIRNCTFTNNTNMQSFYNYTTATMSIYNSVEYGNSHTPINITKDNLTLNHYLSDKTNNAYRTIAYDSSLPLFESDGYTPSRGSQVIDAGDDTLVTSTTDFNGEDRIQGDSVDLGAVEYLLPAIEGLRVINNSPQSNPILYEENATYPADELVEVEGVEEGDDVTYNVENMLYGGDVPVIDIPGTYDITVTVSRLGFRKSRNKNTVAIKRTDGTIQLIEDTIYVGDVAVVYVSVPVDANGYLTCDINGVTQKGTITNGTGVIELEGITAGTHTISIVAHCTNYTDIVLNTTINVIKWDGFLSLTVADADVGENIVITGILPEDFDGIVTITFDGNTYTAIPSGGSFSTNVSATTSGTYTITAVASGSVKYNDVTETATIQVDQVSSYIELSVDNITGGEVAEIQCSVPSDDTGLITVIVECMSLNYSETFTATPVNGSATINISNLYGGNYVVTAQVASTAKYLSASNSTSFTVTGNPKSNTTLTLNNNGASIGGNAVITGSLPNDFNGTASCTFNNTQYTATITNGAFTLTILMTTAGTFNIGVTASGSDVYNDATATTSVVVSSVIPLTLTLNTPSDIYVGDTATISGSVSPTGITNGMATIVIDSTTTYTETIDSTGAFSKQITGLAAGEHTIEVTVSGDGCVADSDTTSITVSKCSVSLEVKCSDINYGKDESVNVILPNDATGTVTGTLYRKGYNTILDTQSATIINGKARIIFPSTVFPKKTYTYVCKCVYEGNNKYLPSSEYTGQFTVTYTTAPIS